MAGEPTAYERPRLKADKPYARGHRAVFFAVLETTRAPSRELGLVMRKPSGEGLRLDFTPLEAHPGRGAVLGLLKPRNHLPQLSFSSLEVRRGRVGRKPPEPLHVLGMVSHDVLRWPRARWRGLLKARARTHDELATGESSAPLQWWLTLELALRGFVPQQALSRVARALDTGLPGLPPSVVQTGPLLVSEAYLERQVNALEKRLASRRHRNPLVDEVSGRQVARWLAIDDADLARLLVERLAATHNLELRGRLGDLAVVLGGPVAPARPTKREAAVADQMLELYRVGAGLSLDELRRRHSSELNIVEWLLEAERLIQAPSGQVFRRDELERHVTALRRHTPDLAQLGVRELKDLLKLKRRHAEGLRAFLVDRFTREGRVADLQAESASG